jgi:predicted kinase
MEAIIFCGIQASGKSTFFKEHFFPTHVRISLDLLRTRHREDLFLATCLECGQRFVADNTNPTRKDREKYILAAKKKGYVVIGYYFASRVEDALNRNSERTGKARIPDTAIRGTAAKLERPERAEGFDQLYHVSLDDGVFIVSEWEDEI